MKQKPGRVPSHDVGKGGNIKTRVCAQLYYKLVNT